jgi:hypothetical protein
LDVRLLSVEHRAAAIGASCVLGHVGEDVARPSERFDAAGAAGQRQAVDDGVGLSPSMVSLKSQIFGPMGQTGEQGGATTADAFAVM